MVFDEDYMTVITITTVTSDRSTAPSTIAAVIVAFAIHPHLSTTVTVTITRIITNSSLFGLPA